MNFPVGFKKCPACGSERTIAQEIKADEVTKERMGEDIQVAVQLIQAGIMDPRRAGKLLSIPILLAVVDICADCGALYCVQANVINGDIKPSMPLGYPPGGGTTFGKPIVGGKP